MLQRVKEIINLEYSIEDLFEGIPTNILQTNNPFMISRGSDAAINN